MNLWNFWICLNCWKRYECETRYTTVFVTILNKCDCWKRWECKTRSDNIICYIVKFVDYEWDMSVKLEKTSEFANCWINGTVEQDENVKRDQTIEFVTLFSMWECLMRLDCGFG